MCCLSLTHGNGIEFFRFNDDPGAEKKMLAQYDEPAKDEVSYSSLGIFLILEL